MLSIFGVSIVLYFEKNHDYQHVCDVGQAEKFA
jgi:hypothetical protein